MTIFSEGIQRCTWWNCDGAGEPGGFVDPERSSTEERIGESISQGRKNSGEVIAASTH